MSMQKWLPLKPKDRIAIVAPSMKCERSTLQAAKVYLRGRGLNVHVAEEIFGRDILCANGREQRGRALLRAIQCQETKAIWCIRGGYGSIHLLPFLRRLRQPGCKIFIGLSDSTLLHTYFQQEWGWATLHGSNIDRHALGVAPKREVAELFKVLFGEQREVQFKIHPLNERAQRRKTIKAPVIGGNLVTLQGNFATPFQIQPKGKILFLEDVGERGYRVDRVLEQIQQMKLLRGVRAIVFGSFTGGREPNGRFLVPKVLQEFAFKVKCPVFAGLPSGHDKLQRTLPLGTLSEIVVMGEEAQLICPTGVRT